MRQNLLIWVRDYCNDQSLNDEGAIAIFLDRAENWLNAHVSGVVSESLGDYSLHFEGGVGFEHVLPNALIMLLRPYKRIKML